MVLVFRRPESPYRSVEVKLHGLKESNRYQLTSDGRSSTSAFLGSELMSRFEIALPEKGSSDLIAYRRADQ